MNFLFDFAEPLIYALVVLSLFFCIKFAREHFLYDKTEDTHIAEHNFAIALNLAGFYLAVGITVMAALSGSDHDMIKDLLYVIGYSLLGVTLITLTTRLYFISVFPDFKRYLRNDIPAAGIYAFGTQIAVAIVTLGAFHGDGTLLSSIVFFLLGQAGLFASRYIWEYLNKLKVSGLIVDGNRAGIILHVMSSISLSIVMYAAVKGAFVSWEQDLYHYFKSFIVGVLFIMVVVNKLLDKLVMPDTDTKTEIEAYNYSSAFVIGSVQIALSIILIGIL